MNEPSDDVTPSRDHSRRPPFIINKIWQRRALLLYKGVTLIYRQEIFAILLDICTKQQFIYLLTAAFKDLTHQKQQKS